MNGIVELSSTANIQVGLFVVALVWLLLLTIITVRLGLFLKRLVAGTQKRDLRQILDQILSEQHVSTKDIAALIERCDQIEKTALHFVQRVGLVRFNPFDETGGDQSFCVALLDAHNNGMVISSLHSRQGTRIYAKPVREGQGTQYQLSKEEQEAIKIAQ